MELNNDQAQPSKEHFLADRFLMDPAEDRSERVVALQTAIADGTYQVSPEQIAEAMLTEQQVRDGTAA